MEKKFMIAAVAAMAFLGAPSQAQMAPQAGMPATMPHQAHGPGMMAQHHGMMASSGHHGMGMRHGYQALGLSEQQRAEISRIREESRKSTWDLRGKLIEERVRMQNLHAVEKRDAAEIGRQVMKMAEIRRQLIEASVEAGNRIDALLTKEQKERLRNLGPGHGMMRHG